MMRRLAVILVVIGALIAGYGGFQIAKHAQDQQNALEKAKALTQIKADPAHFKKWDPKPNDTIGILSIPRLDKDLPIVEGTSPDQLEKGVGHYDRSALPNQNDQIVLSGHRDTVFRRFGELKDGDTLFVKMPYGTFHYVIQRTKIVDANDLSIIHSTKPKEELVLTTCYPFHYVGNAPKRYIIYAYRVNP
ncbi:MAG: class D sortase [Tuberibacillus sp.]